MGDNDVTLSEQLLSATNVNAVFCIACGQPDEEGLHDPARCPAQGGTLDALSVIDALQVFDQSCEEEPDLDEHARGLHCAIVAYRDLSPRVETDPCLTMVKEAGVAFRNVMRDTPGVPDAGPGGRARLRYWAAMLAEMAAAMKAEAAELRSGGAEKEALLLVRLQMSTEETGEWAEALADGDILRAFAELIDISYVTDGHYLTLGLEGVKAAGYRATHAANMSKLDAGGHPIISAAGRWVKGPLFRPAESGLRRILTEAGVELPQPAEK